MFIVNRDTLTKREGLLLGRLEKEYTQVTLENVLLPLISQTSPVSLRAIDWAVVNWSKKHNIVCSSRTPGQMTNIHNSYKKTLSYWKRRLFDPFRRRSRINVMINGDIYETTLGQANFALWTYKTGVLAYVIGHIDTIERDMNRVSKKNKMEKKNALRRGVVHKRTELTRAPPPFCVAYVSHSYVSFN